MRRRPCANQTQSNAPATNCCDRERSNESIHVQICGGCGRRAKRNRQSAIRDGRNVSQTRQLRLLFVKVDMVIVVMIAIVKTVACMVQSCLRLSKATKAMEVLTRLAGVVTSTAAESMAATTIVLAIMSQPAKVTASVTEILFCCYNLSCDHAGGRQLAVQITVVVQRLHQKRSWPRW